MLYLLKNQPLTMKTITIVFFAYLFGSSAFSQTGTLVLNKGQKFNISSQIEANSSQEVMGQTMDSKVLITTASTIEVKDVRDNNYDLINNLARMQMNLSMSGAMAQDVSFDSDKKEDMNSEQGASLKNIINHPNDLTIDNTGKIISGKMDAKKNQDPATNMTASIMSRVLGDPGDGSFGVNLVFQAIPKTAVAELALACLEC